MLFYSLLMTVQSNCCRPHAFIILWFRLHLFNTEKFKTVQSWTTQLVLQTAGQEKCYLFSLPNWSRSDLKTDKIWISHNLKALAYARPPIQDFAFNNGWALSIREQSGSMQAIENAPFDTIAITVYLPRAFYICSRPAQGEFELCQWLFHPRFLR